MGPLPIRSRLALASLVALLAVACSSSDRDRGNDEDDDGGSGTTGGDGEPPALQGMTEAHNAARANVDPPADPPISPLTWSAELAAVAQSYADQCTWEHSGGPYGENLYATSGSAAPADVVASWVAEATSYDHAANSCSDVCGHYTQVVWAASQRIGCGVANCTEGSPLGSSSWQFWVCNYDPPGNYIGERPY